MVKNAPETSLATLEAQVLELVRNEIILQPRTAAPLLAEFLCDYDERSYLAELSPLLTLRYLVRTIKAERRKAHPKPEAALPRSAAT